MDPATIAALMSGGASLGNMLFGGNTVNNQTPATPTGGNAGPMSPIMGATQQQMQPQQSPVQQPDMFQQLLAQAAANSQPDNSAVLSQKPAAVPANAKDGEKKQEDESASIGEVLAAVPEAVNNVAQLLGLNQQNINSERPAPVAGGSPGQPVGMFANTPQGLNIGQLLAALPGIR